MVGRKIGKGYQLYGFTHCIIKGKHVAKCKICDKELQNTAEARMRAHWSACAVTPASKDIHELTHESACKRQIVCSGRSNNLDYAKRARTDNDLIREGENASIRDEKVNILNCPEARKGRDNIALNGLPFVINAAAYENDEDDDDFLSNIENDSGVIEDAVLYSGNNSQLRQELENAAAEYYHTKALCYARLAENSEYKKTLLQLEMRKLHLQR
ncbi:insulator binding factor 1 isoform 1-T2 [Glossina fuscipes fuscipes]